MKKRTKIVCTIGPSSRDKETMSKMVAAGMNVARLNFSHGTHEDHASLIETIRSVSAESGEIITLLQDLQGPKVRVGDLPEEGFELIVGNEVTFTTEQGAALPKIAVSYEGLHEDVKSGDSILLDDGLLEVEVVSVEGRDILTKVTVGGKLSSHKGFNVPTTSLKIPAITEKDKADLKFGIGQNVDWVALSFVRSAEDIKDLRSLIDQYQAELGISPDNEIKIITKVEKHEALSNIDEIIEESDGIMVARGDLGIETPAEGVPVAQKSIIAKCLKAAKPVVVATQMLDSMIRNPRPTRAEVSDVANAVIDHTDAVMLSGESASGKYPLEAVTMMAKVVEDAEESPFDDVDPHDSQMLGEGTDGAISEVAAILAKDVDAKLILVASLTGRTARIVSRHRPALPIAVATHDERVCRQLNLSWGVQPFVIDKQATMEEIAANSIAKLKAEGELESGDKVIYVAGTPVGVTGTVNTTSVLTVE